MNPINTGFGHLQDIRHIIKMGFSNWTEQKPINKFVTDCKEPDCSSDRNTWVGSLPIYSKPLNFCLLEDLPPNTIQQSSCCFGVGMSFIQ